MKFKGSLVFLAAIYPACASAYIGPGAALGLIGSIIATIAVILLGIFGLVLYPLKLAKRKLARAGGGKSDDLSADAERSGATRAPATRDASSPQSDGKSTP